MRQRVMIAIALSCNPQLLIADEPTTALDVTIQAQILDLLERLREEHRDGHDHHHPRHGGDGGGRRRVAVMYAGQIVEQAGVLDLFDSPEHPYTEALLGALLAARGDDIREGRLTAIPGRPPDLVDLPEGCRFAPAAPTASWTRARSSRRSCGRWPPAIRSQRAPGQRAGPFARAVTS